MVLVAVETPVLGEHWLFALAESIEAEVVRNQRWNIPPWQTTGSNLTDPGEPATGIRALARRTPDWLVSPAYTTGLGGRTRNS